MVHKDKLIFKSINYLTDRIHWMGSQFKYTIEDKCATLEEYITPIPTIVLHNVVSFSLDPNIKTNKRNATKPSVNRTL